MTRLAALVRAWLDVPSRAELQPLRRKASESALLWCLYDMEREHLPTPYPMTSQLREARGNLDRALRAHGAMVPFVEERPLVPMEPAPTPRDSLVMGAVYGSMAAVALLLALFALWGCTIRGGADCAGGCPPAEVCAGERCVPADLRPVPAPGGPL